MDGSPRSGRPQACNALFLAPTGSNPQLDIQAKGENLTPCLHPDPCHVTSAFVNILSNLSTTHRELVESIGFGFLFRLPSYSNHNYDFTSWILSRMRIDHGTITIQDGLGIWHSLTVQHVVKILGILNSGEELGLDEIQCTLSNAHQQWEKLGGMIYHDKSIDSIVANLQLVWSEMVELTSTENLSSRQQTLFQSVIILFSVLNVLAPRFKNGSHAPILDKDLLSVALNPPLAKRKNWADYVTKVLAVAVRCYEEQSLQGRSGQMNIPGCCILLQVFVLEVMSSSTSVPRLCNHSTITEYPEETRDKLIQELLVASNKPKSLSIVSKMAGLLEKRNIYPNDIMCLPLEDICSALVQSHAYALPKMMAKVLEHSIQLIDLKVRTAVESNKELRSCNHKCWDCGDATNTALELHQQKDDEFDADDTSGAEILMQLSKGVRLHHRTVSTNGQNPFPSLLHHDLVVPVLQPGEAVQLNKNIHKTSMAWGHGALIENFGTTHGTSIESAGIKRNQCTLTRTGIRTLRKRRRSVNFFSTRDEDNGSSMSLTTCGDEKSNHQGLTVLLCSPAHGITKGMRSVRAAGQTVAQYPLQVGTFGRGSRYATCSRYARVNDETVEDFFGWILNDLLPEDKERDWVLLLKPSSISIKGSELCSQLLDGNEMTTNVAHAIMALFKEQDDSLYRTVPEGRERHFVSPYWAVCNFDPYTY